jgi:hypothetical protein
MPDQLRDNHSHEDSEDPGSVTTMNDAPRKGPSKAAVKAMAQRPGMTPETLYRWLRQAHVEDGRSPP